MPSRLLIKKIIFSFLCVAIFFATINIQKTKAQLAVAEIGGNLFTNIVTTVEQTIDTISQVIVTGFDIQKWANTLLDRYTMPIMKQLAIIMVNKSVQALIGSGNNGKPQFVTNWNDYLFLGPQQRANGYMNSFFDSATRGRLAGASEGVATSYDSYMVNQAQKAIAGQPCAITMQSYTSNPNKMFVDGNMRGFMAFLQPCNNPIMFADIAQTQLTNQTQKEQVLADKQQDKGFLPKMVNGVITAPAILFQSALTGIDQMGTNAIVNATTYPELIAATGISIGAKTLKYNFGSAVEKNQVTTQTNSDTIFKVNYTTDTGLTVGANTGGYTTIINTGQ